MKKKDSTGVTKSKSPSVVCAVEEVENEDWKTCRERTRKADEKVMCKYKAATVIFWDWEVGKEVRYENARWFGEVQFQEGYKKGCYAGELQRAQASEWQKNSLRECVTWTMQPGPLSRASRRLKRRLQC